MLIREDRFHCIRTAPLFHSLVESAGGLSHPLQLLVHQVVLLGVVGVDGLADGEGQECGKQVQEVGRR